MTNFEKVKQEINQMSVDDFVTTFMPGYACDYCAFNFKDDDCKNHNCIYGQQKWLESEVEDDT